MHSYTDRNIFTTKRRQIVLVRSPTNLADGPSQKRKTEKDITLQNVFIMKYR